MTVTVVVEWAGFPVRTQLLAGRGLARSLSPAVLLSVRPDDVHVLPR